jgi:hypothetical protein
MTTSKERSLLIVGRTLTRSTVDRILYGCWSVTLWQEGPAGAVALVTCTEDEADRGFGIVSQSDRIRSLGNVGVRYSPTQTDVLEAVARVKEWAA